MRDAQYKHSIRVPAFSPEDIDIQGRREVLKPLKKIVLPSCNPVVPGIYVLNPIIKRDYES